MNKNKPELSLALLPLNKDRRKEFKTSSKERCSAKSGALSLAICSLALVSLANRADADVISVVAGDFEIATWDASWTSTIAQNYIYTVSGSDVMAMQDRNQQYIEQAISTSDAGSVDAGTYDQYSISFDYGYRRDSTTAGDITLRIALWDTTMGTELVGENVVITDPGVGINSLAPTIVNLAYNSEGLSGNSIALRLTHMGDGSKTYNATAMIDNITATATLTPAAPTPSLPEWAVVPHALSSTEISMSAVEATDPDGVEYYFSCVSGAGNDSGWQSSNTYTDSGLVAGAAYTYKVKYRDLSPENMETQFSIPKGIEPSIYTLNFVENGSFGSLDHWTSTFTNYYIYSVSDNDVMAIQDRNQQYIEQAITESQIGIVDAGTVGDYTVAFDYGYRRDTATSGDITLRVALWDTTLGSEIVGQNLLIADPGVGANSLIPTTMDFNYDNSAHTGNGLALRITHMGDGSKTWQATAMVDNVVLSSEPTSAFAVKHIPYDNDIQKSVGTALAWRSLLPQSTTGYDVYFGTDPSVYNNPKVVDNELLNTFDPSGELAHNTTYYWVVDSHDGVQVNQGETRSFKTEVEPIELTQTVIHNGETITLKLKRESLRGEHFEVWTQNATGGYDVFSPVAASTYFGSVEEHPGAIVAGVKKADGTLWTRVIFDRGETWTTEGEIVTAQTGVNAPEYSFPNLPTAAAGHAGDQIYRTRVALDSDWRNYNRNGDNVAATLEAMEFSVAVTRAIYLRDVLLDFLDS